jgi:hypothetical protein
METSKKPKKAVQFVADAELRGFVSEQAKKKPDNSLLQLLNMMLKQPQKQQDVVWWSLFMTLWNNAPSKGKPFTKDEVIGGICNGSKLTKADAGRAVSFAIKQITELAEAAAEGSKLTKADSGFN